MTHETIAPVQSLVDEMVKCICGDEYPADSYGAGFIHGSGMCENCDAALPAKDISQQADPAAVPASVDEVSESVAGMVIEWIDGGLRFGTDWRPGLVGIIARRLRRHIATLAAAPTPPAQQPVAVPDDLRTRCSEILDWKKSGILNGDALRNYAQDKWYAGEHNSLQLAEGDTAKEAYALIAGLPTPPAQQSQRADTFLLVTPEQVDRHSITAGECPPGSHVILVSSLKRLHKKNTANLPSAPGDTALLEGGDA